MNTLIDNVELAKLLKEKGYSWECENFYIKGKRDKKFHLTTGVGYNSDRNCFWDWNLNGGRSGMQPKIIPYPNDSDAIYYSAPTIAEVIMWLYEKYGIWIECNHCGTFSEFTFKISKLNKKNIKKEPHYMHDFGKGFNSPTEAYKVAIEYILKN